jgi:hypothetical protein
MKRNDDCGFTGSLILYVGFPASCASSRGIEHDEAVDGGETKGDEEHLDSGVDEINKLDIFDADALNGR